MRLAIRKTGPDAMDRQDAVRRRRGRDGLGLVASLVVVFWCSSAAAQEAFRGPFAESVAGEAGDPFRANDEEHLETDRDSFTSATTLVGTGRILVESSYSFIDNGRVPDSHSFPELLTRIGLTERIELRLGWNYEVGGGGSVSGTEIGGEPETSAIERESRALYGLKIGVTEQDGWQPRSAVIVHATTPTSGLNTATDFVAGGVFGWKLPNDWVFDSELRYVAAAEEGDHFNQWAPSTVLRIPFAERWNAHVEYFGVFSDNQAKNVNPQYFSPGIHYLITDDCEIGVRTGWGLNDDASRFFSNLGLGLRF